MSEMPLPSKWSALLQGLMSSTSLYALEADGRRVYRGVRPGPDWDGHGLMQRILLTLRGGALQRVVFYKQRWRRKGTNETCHSRPPDDCASVWFCSLVVTLSLWGWLRSQQGVHTHDVPHEALAARPSPRTVQRWMTRAQPLGAATAHAVRHALIDISEPRSWESYLGGGRSPPADQRRWADPEAALALQSGLDLAIQGAFALTIPVSLLMAEARRRQPDPDQPWLI